MVLTTKYLTYWARVRNEFVGILLVIAIIIVYHYIRQNSDFGTFGLVILGFGVIYMIVSLFKAKTFVNEVNITEDKIIVTGYDFDSRWDKQINVKASDIKIKSKGRGRGNVEYYLRIVTPDKTLDINQSLNWDYPSLLTIFHEFKRIKGEKIIMDEKYLLDYMEKKADGFSSWDIASGKELRK